jgi:hypothetical protein
MPSLVTKSPSIPLCTSVDSQDGCLVLGLHILNIGRVLARALALLDREAPADQKRIAIALATAGIRYASGVLFSGHPNSYGSCRQKRLCLFRREMESCAAEAGKRSKATTKDTIL